MSDEIKAEMDRSFMSGVFSAMQYLVLTRGEPSLAEELAKMHGVTLKWALRESRKTGYQVRKMNKFIRENLRD